MGVVSNGQSCFAYRYSSIVWSQIQFTSMTFRQNRLISVDDYVLGTRVVQSSARIGFRRPLLHDRADAFVFVRIQSVVIKVLRWVVSDRPRRDQPVPNDILEEKIVSMSTSFASTGIAVYALSILDFFYLVAILSFNRI